MLYICSWYDNNMEGKCKAFWMEQVFFLSVKGCLVVVWHTKYAAELSLVMMMVLNQIKHLNGWLVGCVWRGKAYTEVKRENCGIMNVVLWCYMYDDDVERLWNGKVVLQAIEERVRMRPKQKWHWHVVFTTSQRYGILWWHTFML